MHYKQFIVPKNIEIWNKVTQVILCHRKAAASIIRATVFNFSVVSYTHASPSGCQRDRSGSRCFVSAQAGEYY